MKRILKLSGFLFPWLLPVISHASFIETTQGTAVLNDASASYFNPAALMLMPNAQIIPQGTAAYFHSRFSGQSTPLPSGTTESGSSSSHTQYYSPAFFSAMPVKDKVLIGLSIVSNSANRNVDGNSILRYVESSNNIQDYDIVPALAIILNDYFSIGGGVNFSYANFDSKPTIGFPGSNTPDTETHNKSDGTGWGGNIGFLLKPNAATDVGFNYRSKTTYHLSGTSTYEGDPRVVSNDYHYNLLTPARSVLSINHFVTEKLGFITTIQYIEWSAIQTINVYGIAAVVGSTPVIIDANVPQHLRDTWGVTLGSHYRMTPKWTVRAAGTYNQSPGNPHYQIANGDSIILGASMKYEINKTISVDGSYAHAFIKDENIDITGRRYVIQGVNEAARDAVSVKLTFNV